MKKHIEVLSGLGLNVELRGDRVVFENLSGLLVHKLGDGFNLQQYDTHHYGGKNCEWVFLNGVRLARTPKGDFRIFKAIKEAFLNYTESNPECDFSWMDVASPSIKEVSDEELKAINEHLNNDLVEFFEGRKWAIGKKYSDMYTEEISDLNVTTVVTGLKVMCGERQRTLHVRFSFSDMRPTLHSVFLK